MPCAEFLRGQPRVAQFVESLLLEANRKRLHFTARSMAAHQADDGAAVGAAAQERSDLRGRLAVAVPPHRVLHHTLEAITEPSLISLVRLPIGHVPIGLQTDISI